MKKTKISILNIITSIVPSFIIIIIGFLKFKFFINVYGDDLNGIVQLVAQIYAYLSLAELGFGAATNIKLYKYFQEDDEEKITKVFNESRVLYFKSGLFIFIVGILISFVLPFFIKNNSVSTYYIIAIMAMYAVDFLADYLYGLPYRNLLIVNEKIYLINIVKTSQQIFFKILELILILNHVNLLLIILLSVIANLVGSYFLIRITKKNYPFLSKYKGRDRTVTKEVKHIVINNVADIVNEKTDSIIIANQMGLKDTSIYSMYNLIINYLYMFILNFVTGVKGSLGAILNNSKVSKEESFKIFKQFLHGINYISVICFITFCVSASSFMSIFINSDYAVSFSVVLLFGIILWQNLLLKALHVVVEVKGYFQKIKWLALIQAITNIVLSLIFIRYWGLTGVLLATFISSIVFLVPIKVKVAFGEFEKGSTYFYIMVGISILLSAVLIYIINLLNIYSNISNLFVWFIVTGIVFIIVSMVMFGCLYILFTDFRSAVSRVLNTKLVFKIKRFILSRIAFINYRFKVKNKDIYVYSIEKTIDDINHNRASIVRYGDGEMDIIKGKDLKFQKYDAELAKRLDEILSISSSGEYENFYVAIPEIFNGLNQFTYDEKEFWAISLLKTYNDWHRHCKGNYYNAFLSRPYLRYKNKDNCDKIFANIKKMYEGREVILIEGEFSRLGVGNDLFDGVKDLKRILCPTKNAFSMYDEILKTALKQPKKKLILISLGPTAKLLAYDLFKEGYQVIDLGHLDLEYEWYLRKETKKVKIDNKYVNEVDDGEVSDELKDDKYQKEIIENVTKKGKK